MNNTYMAIEFTRGRSGSGYMEILGQICQRLTDGDGNTVTDQPLEYHITDTNPTPPSWGT